MHDSVYRRRLQVLRTPGVTFASEVAACGDNDLGRDAGADLVRQI